MNKPKKPETRDGYSQGSLDQMQRAALHINTVLADLSEEIIIVGGLVPSLLMKDKKVEVPEHAGTMDLDLGLSVGLLHGERYTEISDRLRKAKFKPSVNAEGRMTRQTWEFSPEHGDKVFVDFLIGPVSDESIAGKLQNLEKDFAAFIAAGVPLAFIDKRSIQLSGLTLRGEKATRSASVCGPSAFIAMKAVAFRNRGEPKDAYDLFYVLQYYPEFEEIVFGFKVLLKNDLSNCAKEAVRTLKQDFDSFDAVGTMRAADFLLGDVLDGRDELCADIWRVVGRFVSEVEL